jgi:hypothetical protein
LGRRGVGVVLDGPNFSEPDFALALLELKIATNFSNGRIF